MFTLCDLFAYLNLNHNCVVNGWQQKMYLRGVGIYYRCKIDKRVIYVIILSIFYLK